METQTSQTNLPLNQSVNLNQLNRDPNDLLKVF